MTCRAALATPDRRAAFASRVHRVFGRCTLAFLLPVLGVATPADAQGMGAKRPSGFRLELGLAASTPLLEDGNGVSVRRGVGPVAAGDVLWRLTDETVFAATLRGSVAPLHLRSMERRWSPGSTQQVDFAVRLEEDVAGSFVAGIGLIAAFMYGPDDIVPFRSGEGIVFGWGPELTVARPVSVARRLHVSLGGDAVRISPPGDDARLVGGWVGRLRFGIRHAL